MATSQYALAEVDRVEITTLFDNLVDATASDTGSATRLKPSRRQPWRGAPLEGDLHRSFLAGHGFSMLVRVTRGERTRSLLFDAGSMADGLVYNLERLEMDPRSFEAIVISHGHWDHVGGLIGLVREAGRLEVPLVLHPDAYLTRATQGPDGQLSPPYARLSRSDLAAAGLQVRESVEPSFILDGLALVTGQVERTNDFETGWPAHFAERDGRWEPDPYIWDDQALVINLRGQGLVVVSGCGHAGIVNTVHYAQTITGVERVHAVLGGFHLGSNYFAPRVRPVVDALIDLRPSLIAVAHCTGVRASVALADSLPQAFVQNTVGTRYTLEAPEADEPGPDRGQRRVERAMTFDPLELRG